MGWFPDQPGGLNRYFRGLFSALRAAGVETSATVVGPVVDPSDGVVAVSDRNAPLYARLDAFRRRAQLGGDLVDAHFALYALPALWRRTKGKRLVVHFHGPWADESRSSGARAGVASAKRLLERVLYRRADAIVVLSQAFGRIVVEQYGVESCRVHVIPPGVDLERFSPGDPSEARLRLGLPSTGRIVVCVRRLVPRMGIEMLLEAWAMKRDGLLLVIGDGGERERLESAARRLGSGVRFLGVVDDADLPRYYRAADVSVVPSTELEGFGLVALESLACGTPVVVTNVGGLPESVESWRPDLVVRPTAAAIAARLEAALPEPEACRVHAEQYSWSAAVDRHLDLYKRVLGRQHRVVYLDHTAKLSGGELALLRLLPALAVDAHVILGEDGPLAQRLVAAGVSVEVLAMPSAVRGTRRDALGVFAAVGAMAYALRLARRLRDLRPDIVHTNSLKSCLYGGMAGRIARVPVVWHVRDRIAEDYLPARTVRLIRGLAKVLPTAVIANSRATMEMLPGVPRACVVPSPVEPVVQREPYGGRLRFGVVGRIAPWKGQHLFIEALALAFPDGGVDGVVIGAPLFGDDELEYLEQVRTLADRGPVGVEFVGFSEDVAAELGRLSVLVHASLIPEPFGQVVVEGMAAGLPVVAAAAGGPLEFIDDGVDGLLYPSGDARELADRLVALAAAPELRARLGEAARLKAAAFTPERVALQVEAVYEEVLRR
jgi:glycosyltransferase involved in cell wall biosynthesis